jgi:hypothetical protein
MGGFAASGGVAASGAYGGSRCRQDDRPGEDRESKWVWQQLGGGLG